MSGLVPARGKMDTAQFSGIRVLTYLSAALVIGGVALVWSDPRPQQEDETSATATEVHLSPPQATMAANFRLIKSGMSQDQVTRLLGPPDQVTALPEGYEVWSYGLGDKYALEEGRNEANGYTTLDITLTPDGAVTGR